VKALLDSLLMLCEGSVRQSIGVYVKALLDKDPVELAISNEVYTLLKRSNIGRFSLLTSLLSRLGLNCDKPVAPPLSPICLLATSEVGCCLCMLMT